MIIPSCYLIQTNKLHLNVTLSVVNNLLKQVWDGGHEDL